MLVNPATAGIEYIPVVALSFRKQWPGLDQSPYHLNASASLRVGNYDFYNPKMMINRSHFRNRERIGLGMGMYADQNGPQGNRGIVLAYAYHLPLDNSSVSMGLSGSMEQSLLDGTSWDPILPDDPLLSRLKETFYTFNANAGICYYGAEYIFGMAVNNLLPLRNKPDPSERVKQDFILHGAYVFRSRERISIEPSVNIRYLDYENIEYDIRAKMYIQHSHWICLSYRSYRALNLAAGIWVKGYYLAYDFEINLTPMVHYSAGTHGIHLGMNLGMRSY